MQPPSDTGGTRAVPPPRRRGGRAAVVVAALLLIAGQLLLGPRLRSQTPAPPPGGTSGGPFGFGRPATAADIAAGNIDILPDGTGLPPGSGTVGQGQLVYAAKCAACHGATGSEGGPLASGGGSMGILVGRTPLGPGVPKAAKTIGNFWPYATTVWDYIHRAMPADAPGSLTPDEVYALVAYLLNANGIIPDDAVLNAQTLPQVVMPNVNGFVPDPRPDVP
jgi:mono/diheme cytochrome c family protein